MYEMGGDGGGKGVCSAQNEIVLFMISFDN